MMKKLGYQEAIRLVKLEDVNKINEFFSENLNNQQEFKKKDQKYTIQSKKKKKR